MRRITIVLVYALFTPMALGGPELVQFPGDYKTSFEQYSSRDRQAKKQIVDLYANAVATESAKDGAPLDPGSVLVMEVYKAKTDDQGNVVTKADGGFEKGALAAIVAMEKRAGWGTDYAEDVRNGEWEYAKFSPDGVLAGADATACLQCHKPLAASDFLFSFDDLAAQK